MRNAFAQEIVSLAAEDSRIVLLSADIGNRLFDSFKERFPNRFFNCGVAEANMIGMAAGLALSGLRPIAYTITPFVTSRCLEQIKIDVCYHNVPVTIVGVGSGLSYAGLGPTHHSCDEIAALRALPHISIICPADSFEVKAALRCAIYQDQPVYMRIGKKGEPAVHESTPTFSIGKIIPMVQGADACLLGNGTIMPVALRAAALLKERRITLRVENVHTIKPLDDSALGAIFDSFNIVITLEEHSVIGGLGGAVAEWMADHHKHKTELIRLGTPDDFCDEVGNQEYMREKFGLTPKAIADLVERTLKNRIQ